MHTTILRRVGGSVMLAVPPAVLEMLDLRAGATVGVVVDAGRLIVEPQRQSRYTLEELLAQCDPAAEVTADITAGERDWLDDRPVGGELL